MFQTLRNAWRTKDLKDKIVFTLFIFVIYRIGTAIPIPYINAAAVEASQLAMSGSIFDYFNLLSGSAFAQGTLFALGVQPYITSSIVMQLLCIAIPYLERLSKEGEEGKKKINKITRFVTIGLGLITAFGYYTLLKNYDLLTENGEGWFAAIVVVLCYCAGSSIVMWLGEKINEHGIGNGVSMILFANIVSGFPTFVGQLYKYATGDATFTNKAGEAVPVPVWAGIILAVVALAATVAMVGFIVWMTNSERRIPIQYAKKVVGRKMYGGQSSTLPLKVNMTGVMPMIFASSIVSIIPTIDMFVDTVEGSFWDGFFKVFAADGILYAIFTFILIIAFAYFYTSISFNATEVANNLKANGGSVPGIRPGRPTAEFIQKILNRVTFIGALLLSVVAVLPLLANIISGGNFSVIAFGGSSIIIVVGVILETIREIEAQLTMRHYKGFLE